MGGGPCFLYSLTLCFFFSVTWLVLNVSIAVASTGCASWSGWICASLSCCLSRPSGPCTFGSDTWISPKFGQVGEICHSLVTSTGFSSPSLSILTSYILKTSTSVLVPSSTALPSPQPLPPLLVCAKPLSSAQVVLSQRFSPAHVLLEGCVWRPPASYIMGGLSGLFLIVWPCLHTSLTDVLGLLLLRCENEMSLAFSV